MASEFADDHYVTPDGGETWAERRLPGGSLLRATAEARLSIEPPGGRVDVGSGAVWVQVPAEHRLHIVHGPVSVTVAGGSAVIDVAIGGGLVIVVNGEVEIENGSRTMLVPPGHGAGFDTIGRLKEPETLAALELAGDSFIALNLVLDASAGVLSPVPPPTPAPTVVAPPWRRRLVPAVVVGAMGLLLGTVIGSAATTGTSDPTAVTVFAPPPDTFTPPSVMSPKPATTTMPGAPARARVGECAVVARSLTTTGVVTGGPPDTRAYRVSLGMVDLAGRPVWRAPQPITVPVVGGSGRWRGVLALPGDPPPGSTCRVLEIRPLGG